MIKKHVDQTHKAVLFASSAGNPEKEKDSENLIDSNRELNKAF